jgi:ABC-type Fe3+/spermidine/putrescine transport system ATPase subunit
MNAMWPSVTDTQLVVPDLVPDFAALRSRGGARGTALPRAEAGAAVACRGVVKDFDSGGAALRVLHGIDLDIAAGEMTLLVGPSGCGKTTLISIIAGILTPTEGEVIVQGENLGRLSDARKAAFRRRAIGFIFQ